MAPRLKNLNVLWVQERNPDILFFSLKSPGKRTPSRFPNGAPMEREACLQGILHISQKAYLSGSPIKEPSLKVPLMESLTERCPSTRALLHSSIKVPGTRAPPHMPGSPPMETGPHGERCSYMETFLTYLPGSPLKELPPRPPPRSLFKERCSISRAPFIQLSKSPVDEPSYMFPKRGPYGNRCPSPEPFLHMFQGPHQGSHTSRFPSQSSHRERRSTSRDPFNHISNSPVDKPTPGCPAEPSC